MSESGWTPSEASTSASLIRKKTIVAPNGQVLTVLPQNEYEDALSEVIKRDFFPDLKDIELQNQILDMNPQPSLEELEQIRNLGEVVRLSNSSSQYRKGALAEFLETHTSEDDVNFQELLQNDRRQKHHRIGWAVEAEKKAHSKDAESHTSRRKLIALYKLLLEKNGHVNLIEHNSGHTQPVASNDELEQISKQIQDGIHSISAALSAPSKVRNSLMFGPSEHDNKSSQWKSNPQEMPLINIDAARFSSINEPNKSSIDADFDDTLSEASVARATGQMSSYTNAIPSYDLIGATPNIEAYSSTTNSPLPWNSYQNTRRTARSVSSVASSSYAPTASSTSKRSSRSKMKHAQPASRRLSHLSPAARSLLFRTSDRHIQ